MPTNKPSLKTLNRLVAALHDGHGGVYHLDRTAEQIIPTAGVGLGRGPARRDRGRCPGSSGLKPGDVVVEIDGIPAEKLLAENEATISSATPQWRRARALNQAAAGTPGSEIALKIRRTRARPATSSTPDSAIREPGSHHTGRSSARILPWPSFWI